MPFDRESFIQGYMTGLNLSRAPGGQGRKPDVPRGKYILAEDGTNILAETLVREDVSIYESGVWYEVGNPLDPSYPSWLARYRFVKNGDNIPCKFIIGRYPSNTNPYAYFFTSDPDLSSATVYDDLSYTTLHWSVGSVYVVTKNEKSIYVYREIAIPGGGSHPTSAPIDAVIAEGANMFALLDLCWDIWYGPTNPLITE